MQVAHKQFTQQPDGSRLVTVSLRSKEAQLTITVSDLFPQDEMETNLSDEASNLLPEARKLLTKLFEENGI